MTSIADPVDKEDAVLEHHEHNDSQPRAHNVAAAIRHDAVAPEAVGGVYEEMPQGYYWSPGFLGTLLVCSSSS